MLMDVEFWRRLEDLIDEHRAGQISRVISGHLGIDDYKLTAGIIQGLDFVKREAQVVYDDLMGIKHQEQETDE